MFFRIKNETKTDLNNLKGILKSSINKSLTNFNHFVLVSYSIYFKSLIILLALLSIFFTSLI